jgi:predicted nucleic acid-binding protein
VASEVLVLDSWPVLEWMKAREPSAARFDALLAWARTHEIRLLMSSINLGEVYYNSWGVWGEVKAELVLSDLDQLPIHVFHPKQEDVIAAARIKATYHCSYADAFAVVLAQEFESHVASGDRDFRRMSDGGAVKLDWWGV